MPFRISVGAGRLDSPEGLQSIVAEVAKVVPKAATLKPEDVIDASLIEKLDKSGFIDGLYK